MSVDNGIYVLKTPVRFGEGFEYRIAQVQAIDIMKSHSFHLASREDYLMAVYGRSWVFHSPRRARHAARLMNEDFCESFMWVLHSGLHARLIARLTHADFSESVIRVEYGVPTIAMSEPFPARRSCS